MVGRTTVVVAHRLSTVIGADSIAGQRAAGVGSLRAARGLHCCCCRLAPLSSHACCQRAGQARASYQPA